MQLNKYFKREEFTCGCGCGFDVVDFELLGILTEIRESFGQPVYIHSGCRCKAYNESIGGVEHSQHTLGKGVDFSVRGVDPKVIGAFTRQIYPNKLGIGIANSFIHIDVREDKPRNWTY